MNRFSFAFRRCIGPAIALMLAIVVITCGVFYIKEQNLSKESGLVVILVDSTPQSGSAISLKKEIMSVSGMKNVGVFTLETASASQYAKTIENYSLEKYIRDTAIANGAELLIIPEQLLQSLYSLGFLDTLDFDSEHFDSVCFYNGALTAFPLKGIPVTVYGDEIASTNGEAVFAVLVTNSDNTDAAKAYLSHLNSLRR